jgi:capsule polysaccharide modification protein KpsS
MSKFPTIKEFSKMNPNKYRVYDLNLNKGQLRSWHDIITIAYEGEYKDYKRRSLYKHGLAVRAHE